MQKNIIPLLLMLFCCQCAVANSQIDSLLNVLDQTIQNHQKQVAQHESRILHLKATADHTQHNSIEKYNLNHQLYREYKAFICDSAIHYLNENIKIANGMNDNYRTIETKLKLSMILSSTGMYMESIDVLESINRHEVPPHLTSYYYMCFGNLYGPLSIYTQDKNLSLHYQNISQAYNDSLYSSVPHDTEEYLKLHEQCLLAQKLFQDALKINDIRLAKTEADTPQYALVTFHRSLIYKQSNDRVNQEINLCLSAIADIRSAIRDHASLWTLAQLLYEDGDMERAYRYMRFSWNETQLYNTRLRSWQSADVLSLVDKTYQGLIEQQNDRLESSLIVITVLLMLLLIAIGYIYAQMKKLANARNHLQTVNAQLNVLNLEQMQMNQSLSTANIELNESNQIKEEYIGRFIQLCSTYINRLDAYRRMVNKKISHSQTSELLKITRSQNALDEELHDLYHNFDSAFLHIFPNFVSQFNELLQDDKKIILKKDELLNTELRIFALIRLGIDDSSKIAEFLRYSVNTIYNYRAKVKNKARGSRDDFEESVRNIR